MSRNKTDYQIKMILKHAKEGSTGTQQTRHNFLMEAVKTLREEYGYGKHWKVENFGAKEVHRLVKVYESKGNKPVTIDNKLSALRWLGRKVGATNISEKNSDFGIKSERTYTNEAVHLTKESIAHLDPRMQLIFELKFKTGLREEEALKLRPSDIKSDRIELKITKGGRPRTLMLDTPEKVDLAQRLAEFNQVHSADKSMIPADLKYNTYRHRVQTASREMGIKGHGYRHAFAHNTFEKISGIKAPLAGGPSYSRLSPAEKSLWNKAAVEVNRQLGHGDGRHDTTATYIGTRE